MDRDLDSLNVFAHIAQLRSFRKAGQVLGVSPSALSHAMTRLEDDLGVRLLNRTTRSVIATAAGERLLASLVPALASISEALDVLNDDRTRLRGRVRINVPRPAAQLLIAPRLGEWAVRYPEIALEVVSNDAVVDIVQEGFDAGVRFGELLQQDMVAVPVGEAVRFVVCAAPSYLDKHGAPASPQELLKHQCIGLRFPSGARYRWQFQQEGHAFDVATEGPLLLDDMHTIVQAAVDGAGICYTYESFARLHAEAGQLQYLLQDAMPPPERFYLYYAAGRHQSAALRALIGFFKD